MAKPTRAMMEIERDNLLEKIDQQEKTLAILYDRAEAFDELINASQSLVRAVDYALSCVRKI